MVRPFFLRIMFFLVQVFLVRFLGSEGRAIMTTGLNLVLFAILILGLIFMFRLYCFRLNKKCDFLLLYLSILFVISFFCYFLRIYLVSRLGLHLGDLLSFLILSVGGGQALPLPAPYSPSHSSSWSEDSFEIGVLLEPFSETDIEGTNLPIRHNSSLETSLLNRINNLQR